MLVIRLRRSSWLKITNTNNAGTCQHHTEDSVPWTEPMTSFSANNNGPGRRLASALWSKLFVENLKSMAVDLKTGPSNLSSQTLHAEIKRRGARKSCTHIRAATALPWQRISGYSLEAAPHGTDDKVAVAIYMCTKTQIWLWIWWGNINNMER